MAEQDPLPYESVWMRLSKIRHRLDWVDVGGIRTRYLQAGRPEAPALIKVQGMAGNRGQR